MLSGEYHGLELLNGGVGKVGTQSNAQAAVYGRWQRHIVVKILPRVALFFTSIYSRRRFVESYLSVGGAETSVFAAGK